MAKGVAIKFKSYEETVPKLLHLIKLDKELGKHNKIILKVHLEEDTAKNTPKQFVENVLKYCMENKGEGTEFYIAEGADGADTMDLFEKNGYQRLAEQYSVGLLDLNTVEVEEVIDSEFLKFQNIKFPKILFDSFVISLPKLMEDAETDMQGSLSIMTGAYPAKFYSGIFSRGKNKIRKWPIKYSIYDILVCKRPELAIIDASEKGVVLAGIPFEMDKQATKLFGKEWRTVQYLKLIDESYHEKPLKEAQEKEETGESSGKEENSIS
jgi:uncharacterized protein (DUF362 family)